MATVPIADATDITRYRGADLSILVENIRDEYNDLIADEGSPASLTGTFILEQSSSEILSVSLDTDLATYTQANGAVLTLMSPAQTAARTEGFYRGWVRIFRSGASCDLRVYNITLCTGPPNADVS